VLLNKIFDIEINKTLTICARFCENGFLKIYEKDDEKSIIGKGKWYKNGKLEFEKIRYVAGKVILSFNGYANVKKIVGRLLLFRDDEPLNCNKDDNDNIKTDTNCSIYTKSFNDDTHAKKKLHRRANKKIAKKKRSNNRNDNEQDSSSDSSSEEEGFFVSHMIHTNNLYERKQKKKSQNVNDDSDEENDTDDNSEDSENEDINKYNDDEDDSDEDEDNIYNIKKKTNKKKMKKYCRNKFQNQYKAQNNNKSTKIKNVTRQFEILNNTLDEEDRISFMQMTVVAMLF